VRTDPLTKSNEAVGKERTFDGQQPSNRKPGDLPGTFGHTNTPRETGAAQGDVDAVKLVILDLIPRSVTGWGFFLPFTAK
jgi:hypothetical protein